MQEEPNPYQSPLISEETSIAIPIEPSSLNYPGGLMTPAAIGLAGGLLVMLFALGTSFGPQTVWLMFTGMLSVWSGSFALVGWLLPGPRQRRVFRAVIMFFLSFPAVILYVPVCGFSAAVLSGGGSEEPAMVFASLIAFTSVLVLFAIIIRFRARRTAPYANPLPETASGPFAPDSFDAGDHPYRE